MTVARPERVATEKAQAVIEKLTKPSQKRSLSTCECGGEVMELNADSGYCLDCGIEWTSASVYQSLYCRDFDDNEDDIPF